MVTRFGYVKMWLLLLAVAAAGLLVVAIPVYLIQPFAAQTARTVEVSYLLRTWSPVLTILLAAIAIILMVFIWRQSKRWFGKLALILPLFVIIVFSWFARQNHFEWMFNPLGQTSFVKVSEANFVADGDMILAVKINGDAVAFPVRQMAYHHIAQAVVGGTPITATY